MIHAIIISMKGDTARREAMEAHLTERGFDFEFFDAIDGRQMDVLAHPDYLKSKRRAAHGRDIKGGELGCMLSHRAAYQYILDQGYDHALLLEDDARLVPETKEVLENFLAKNIDYDIIRLMGSPKVMNSPQRMILKINPLPTSGGGSGWGGKEFYLTRMKTTPGGAHATLISRTGAQKLIKATQKFAFPIDTVLGRCWETGINAYSIKPAMAVPDEENFETTIGDARHDKQIHLQGLEKLKFKIGRPLFKLEEALGKRKTFARTAKPDLALSKKFGGIMQLAIILPLALLLAASCTTSMPTASTPEALAGKYHEPRLLWSIGRQPQDGQCEDGYHVYDWFQPNCIKYSAATSTLEIKKSVPNDKGLKVSLDAYFTNYHSCGFSDMPFTRLFETVWRTDKSYYDARPKDEHCILDMIVTDTEITLKENIELSGEGACRYYCGARGSLHQNTFARSNKVIE